MVDKIRISKIENGFVLDANYPFGVADPKAVYFSDMSGVIKHMDSIWGTVKIRSEKEATKES